MRYVWMVITALIVIALLAFVYVNRDSVELAIPFTGMSLTAPLFLILIGTYLLGMVSGGSLINFIRSSVRHATEKSKSGSS